MKEKLSGASSQILILILAGILMLLTIQMAKAQSGANANSQNSLQGNNVITTKMPKKTFMGSLLQKTSLSYYHMFLGPTLSGNVNETYNVFQEGTDQPNTGKAPLQSFQSAILRYDFNNDWGVGASLALSNGYTGQVVNQDKRGDVTNRPDTQFYNARAHLYVPSFAVGNLFKVYSTLSYEAPTSVISRQDKMKFGLVLTENLAFNTPASSKWSGGVTGQIYRMVYENNQKAVPGCSPLDCTPTQLQTQIITISPYANYRINDKWNWGNMVILDWDQRGVQADSREFNNNLPHRVRTTISYYPNRWNITNVGVFTQALMKFRPGTTAVGAELAMRF